MRWVMDDGYEQAREGERCQYERDCTRVQQNILEYSTVLCRAFG